MPRPVLFALVLVSCSATALSVVANPGPETLSSSRRDVEAAYFKISFQNGTTKPDYVKQAATVGSHAMLGAPDVQASLVRVSLRARRAFPPHAHPRGAEALYLQKGNLEAFFRMEGGDGARVVRNTVLSGQAVVFPQGLAHGVRCVSVVDCVYVAFFTSSDAGNVAVPGL